MAVWAYRNQSEFTTYTCPEKFRTTSQGAEMGQNFSGELYDPAEPDCLDPFAPSNLCAFVSGFRARRHDTYGHNLVDKL